MFPATTILRIGFVRLTNDHINCIAKGPQDEAKGLGILSNDIPSLRVRQRRNASKTCVCKTTETVKRIAPRGLSDHTAETNYQHFQFPSSLPSLGSYRVYLQTDPTKKVQISLLPNHHIYATLEKYQLPPLQPVRWGLHTQTKRKSPYKSNRRR